MARKTTLTYRGPAPLGGALAQMLEEEGVLVSYSPRMEQRGAGEVVEAVILTLVCSGAYDLVKAGVIRFRTSRFGKVAQVDLPEEDSGD